MKGIFLDLETTGLDPTQHCPIDIAFKVVELATGEDFRSISNSYQTLSTRLGTPRSFKSCHQWLRMGTSSSW